MSTETGTGVKRRDFLKILGATGATTAVVGCSSEKVGKLIPYVASPDNTVAGRLAVLRDHLSRVRVRLRRPGRSARRPAHQAGRQSGPPAQSRRDLRDGTVGGAGALQPRPLPLADGARGRCAQADHVGQGLRTAGAEARRGEEQGTGGQRRLRQPARDGHVPGLPRSVAGGAGDARAPEHRSARATGHDRRQPEGVRHGLAGARFLGAPSSIVSFGADFLDGWGHNVPQQLDWADARAKLEGAPQLVYIGARRSLTGLNADQWIAAKPGSDMAICAALNGRARWPRPRTPRAFRPPRSRPSRPPSRVPAAP